MAISGPQSRLRLLVRARYLGERIFPHKVERRLDMGIVWILAIIGIIAIIFFVVRGRSV